MKMKQSSMRSASLNQDIKMMKTVNKNPPVSKKKKSSKLNPPMRDTISETISFVIKGKLTPIKPILLRKEIDLINSKCKAKSQKTVKKTNRKATKIKKIKEEPLRIKSKVQTKTAKNTSAQNIFKNKSDTVVVNLVTQSPKANSKHSKLESKIINKRPKAKEEKPKKDKKNAPADKTLKTKTVAKVTKKQYNKKKIDKPLENKTVIDEDEIKKQQTIEKLLKEVNEEIKSKKIKPSKHKSSKTKKKNVLGQNKVKKINDSDESTLTNEDPMLQKDIKSELIESIEVPKSSVLPTNDIILESNAIKKEPESNEKKDEEQLSPSNKRYRKLKTKPKITMMKKRILSKNKNKVDKPICKTKLFKFWNGPKRHRVASLNALAKVHCLYENETKGNILDIVDESSKLPYSLKRDTKNKNTKNETLSVKDVDNRDSSPTPTRILRSVPGLRAVGKHWDMHDTSSSDEEDFIKFANLPVKVVKKEKLTQPKLKLKDDVPTEKKRKPSEIVMDLKDMVVSKRMASLNASAILAASYSVEKRSNKSKDSNDDTSSCASNSSEEYFAALSKDIKEEEVDETKENDKLVEVHTTPNKNVAVILNQDTDVTITGVYVNSTTRSTHHEGYCSIAGMQYRISATSHTQTAATAVATETLLQSSSSSGPDNSNSDSMPSSKSYTPLDALSNMQPPPGPGIQHNHPVLHGQQQHMGPPQHVLPLPPHQLSPGLRHGCSSAFSSPNSSQNYQIPSGHNPPIQGEGGFVHGYYQPAGPLISVPPTHCSSGQPPPPVIPPLTKTVPLPDASPTTSTTPSLSSHEIPPPPPSSNGDSSDSEVIITSVTAAKDNVPSQAHASSPYRYPQYPSYQYSYPAPYSYPPAPLPPNPHPPYSHHDMCYSNPYGHKWTYRRHLSGSQYYPVPNPQEMYPVPHAVPSPQSQQMVTTTPVSASGTFSSPIVGPPPPPPTIMETYAGPLESYQPPQPSHFYPSPVYPPPGPCYSHQPTRTIPYLSTYQSNCPCPMQSCPKNVLTGPLTGDSKRSNMTSISNDSMPLPSIALVLPSEPASATGPPSPARGSAGMPPPPSPAGATYQPPPVATKQESHSPISEEDFKLDKKKKARIGKAMVRRNIAANMQQNTMLLMCNPVQDYVKREIESPQNIELEQKRNTSSDKDNLITQDLQNSSKEITNLEMCTPLELRDKNNVESSKKILENCKPLKEEIEDPLPPVINTVAENVKVKNMKRKLSMCSEKISDSESPPQKKRKKAGSYKYLIKKETNAIKINNGKLKLLGEMPSALNSVRTKTKLRRPTTKNKLSFNKESAIIRRKLYKQLPLNTLNCRPKAHRLTHESKIKNSGLVKKGSLRQSTKSAPAVLDKLFAKNNVERIIESVIGDTLRTSHESKTEKCIKQSKYSPVKTNVNKISVPKKMKNVTKKLSSTRRTFKHNEASTPQIPKAIKRSLSYPRWSNGWIWEGEPFEAKVFLNSDELTVMRKCFPAMRHLGGDKIVPRDCVLLKAGPRKNDLPFVAKIASLWENPDDGEMMMSLLWYYRPEHTEQGRLPTDQSDEVFASRHKDSNSVACIDDKCYVLTFNEYCRYRKTSKRIEAGIEEVLPCIPNPEPYPRSHRQPPMTLISPEMVFFCRRVYDFRQKRIMKNPT